MDSITEAQLAQGVAAVAMLVQFVKRLPVYEEFKQWTPLISIIFGIGISFATNVADPIIGGIMIGVSSSGVYSFVKSLPPKQPTG